MKRFLICAMLVLLASGASSALKFKGSGPAITFDPSCFPPEYQEKYKLMEVKCSNPACHTIERAVIAIRDGVTPITKTNFDKEAAKAYGVKMMRKPDSGMNKKEAKAVVELLYFLLDKAKRR